MQFLARLRVVLSVSAGRTVMAASRFLAGAAACKILLSFAAESGVAAWLHACDSDLSTNFLNFGNCDFPFKIPLKNCFKIVLFSALAPRSGFGAAIFCCQYVLESFFVESLLCAKACCVKNIAV